MDSLLFSLHDWPQAIVHVDGDAFFTSCEEAIHPELRGKPIITGAERGIVACASYAAKKAGIARGVSLREARRICPDLVILPSDYETYSLFSRRLFGIMRRFTPQVEEYSIDEAFADITGMRRAFRGSYEAIADAIRVQIGKELSLTVSVGLSLTKVLAKAASKRRKPDGLTVIPGRAIARHLQDLPVGKVWGIGPATTNYLNKMGIQTALEFARMPEAVVRKRLTKPGVEIWRELRGESVYTVSPEEKSVHATISKMKTFAPPSSDRDYLFAQLTRNLESACIKARHHGLAARKLIPILKQQSFETLALEFKLSRPSNCPIELSTLTADLFDRLYAPRVLYRATGIVLADLRPHRNVQYSLFDDVIRAERIQSLYEAVDAVSDRYGKHTLHLGSSHLIEVRGQGKRGKPTARQALLLPGETRRKHLPLPVLQL